MQPALALAQQASAALTDGASIATMIATGLAVIAAIAAWMKSAIAVKESNAATIAAANAEARAEEAIKLAARATTALAGLYTTSAEQLEDQRAERDAPAILERWVNSTLVDGRNREPQVLWSEQMYRFVHPCIADRTELFAAKLASFHKDVAHVMKRPEIGKPLELLIYNPKSTAQRWRDDDVR